MHLGIIPLLLGSKSSYGSPSPYTNEWCLLLKASKLPLALLSINEPFYLS